MGKRTNGQSALVWIGILAIALSVVVMLGSTVMASTLRRGGSVGAAASAGQGTFSSGYFDLGAGSSADNIIRLENPTAFNGNMCAMIYVFNTRESMGECCGCLLTPNQMRRDSIKQVIGTK